MDSKICIFNKALSWIKENSIDGKGIRVTSKKDAIYPEVTGYFIPTLLRWGERELALSYAQYLCSIQKDDGSWYDSNDIEPYVFDSAQILKGLISIRNLLPEVDSHIIKGCDWILTNMKDSGRLTTPSKDAWGNNEDFCSELIHLYCLEPIRNAGQIFDRQDYLDAVDKILLYYKNEKMDKIMNFSLLSHFYAYVMEALFDLGEIDLCKEAMTKLEKYRNDKNVIPALKDVPWICSTGLFQLALVWYKLGELDKGNSLFYYALSLQNKTGGWYGSYPKSAILSHFYRGSKRPYYFPDEEISWANKYFLDALAYKERLEFEKQASSFLDNINIKDGRYMLIDRLVCELQEKYKQGISICDVGCGKGRYLKNLVAKYPNNIYSAMDLSRRVMQDLTYVSEKKEGVLTNIPFGDSSFEFVYVCEALEHAINIEGALKELYRITKSGGQICIIDKPLEKAGALQLYEWETWIDDNQIENLVKILGGYMDIVMSVPYEDNKDDGLFRAWIIKKI